jgi:hypothetical protein
VLKNADPGTLTVHQIAAHLRTRPDNITYELNLGRTGQAGRLTGRKIQGPGIRGRNGQWRVNRTVYLDWLGVPVEDREMIGPDGLPLLYSEGEVAGQLERTVTTVRTAVIVKQQVPHIGAGRQWFLTHHQLERLRVLLDEDCRDLPR